MYLSVRVFSPLPPLASLNLEIPTRFTSERKRESTAGRFDGDWPSAAIFEKSREKNCMRTHVHIIKRARGGGRECLIDSSYFISTPKPQFQAHKKKKKAHCTLTAPSHLFHFFLSLFLLLFLVLRKLQVPRQQLCH